MAIIFVNWFSNIAFSCPVKIKAKQYYLFNKRGKSKTFKIIISLCLLIFLRNCLKIHNKQVLLIFRVTLNHTLHFMDYIINATLFLCLFLLKVNSYN